MRFVLKLDTCMSWTQKIIGAQFCNKWPSVVLCHLIEKNVLKLLSEHSLINKCFLWYRVENPFTLFRYLIASSFKKLGFSSLHCSTYPISFKMESEKLKLFWQQSKGNFKVEFWSIKKCQHSLFNLCLNMHIMSGLFL